MLQSAFSLATLGFVWALTAGAQPALEADDPVFLERRLALVIGNGTYDHLPQLATSTNDARDMAAALEAVGFEVTLQVDIDRDQMRRALVAFGRSLREGGVGLFYFSGHAVQLEGSNYLIPVDGESDPVREMVGVGEVLTRMGGDTRLNILILDTMGDLAQIQAPPGTFVANAAANPGGAALDAGGFGGTPYTAALVRALDQPGLSIEEVFGRVRKEVGEHTAGLQIPQFQSSTTGDFYFRPAKPAGATRFPWPPPRASGMDVIPPAFFRPSGATEPTLGEVANQIDAALDAGRYFERSYFAAPGGFALVTRLEQINLDGTSKREEIDRWSVTARPLRSFSLADYLRALFTAPAGYYRIIVFVASSEPFAQSDKQVGRSEAIAWLSEGLNTLPEEIAQIGFTNRHVVTALIYEFEQPGHQEAMLVLPGNLTGRVHLERAHLWDALRQ